MMPAPTPRRDDRAEKIRFPVRSWRTEARLFPRPRVESGFVERVGRGQDPSRFPYVAERTVVLRFDAPLFLQPPSLALRPAANGFRFTQF